VRQLSDAERVAFPSSDRNRFGAAIPELAMLVVYLRDFCAAGEFQQNGSGRGLRIRDYGHVDV
jgi:hypothetical protein